METIHSLINGTPVAHVSFVPDPINPLPVVLPMIARIGTFHPASTSPELGSEPEPAVYIHGYVSARLFKPKTSSTHDAESGLPVCIAATKIVNLVLALTPFNHSYDYRSAIVHGHATLLDPKTDEEEVLFAMRLITDGIVPDRWDNCRTPPDAGEIAATRILKVRIDSASAKIRDSGVKDDKKDLGNAEVTGKVWTGTIPYVEMLGEPVPAGTNKVMQVPEYLTEFVGGTNERAIAASGVRVGAPVTGLMSKMWSSVFGR